MQVATDATTFEGGFEHVAFCLRIKDEDGETSSLSLGTALTESKTAQGEVKAIDERVIKRLQKWIKEWRDSHKKEFPEDEEGLKCIPEPENLNWHRLKGRSNMQDACAQAQSMSKEIEAQVRKTYAETIGVPVEELDEEEVAVFKTFCHNHLRNTCARRAIKFEAAYLAPKFAECKQRLDLSKLRVTGDVSAALRAAAKAFVFLRLRGYAKGSGLKFFSWANARRSKPSRTRPASAPRATAGLTCNLPFLLTGRLGPSKSLRPTSRT